MTQLLFNTKKHSLFFLTRMVTNYLLFVVKIFVCALCCANLFFGFSFSLISKTEQICTLHCNKKIIFAMLLETRVSLKKHYFLLLVHVDSCLFCGRNDTDIGRGSSVGVKPSHFLFLLLFLFSLSSLPFFTIVFFFVFFFFIAFFVPFCNSSFHLPVFCFICFSKMFSSLLS